MKKCCVLIPYFNDGPALISSLDSVNEASTQVDVIVVDDGSKEIKAKDVLKEYKGTLKINLVVLPLNQGIEHALNSGLKLFSDNYEYIARLDCGDTCVNNRIQKQISYLDANPECQVVGSWAEFTDMEGRHILTIRHPIEHNEIKKGFMINSMIVHVSAMFRASIFKQVGFYPTDTPAAEDYALFSKIIKTHKMANIGEILVKCTVNPLGISTKKRHRQIASRIKIMLANFSFTPYAFLGIARSTALLLVPRTVSLKIKKLVDSKTH